MINQLLIIYCSSVFSGVVFGFSIIILPRFLFRIQTQAIDLN